MKYTLNRNAAIEAALASYLDAVQSTGQFCPRQTRAVLWGLPQSDSEFDKVWASLTFKVKNKIREEAMALVVELRPKHSESTHKRVVADLGFRLRAERSDKQKPAQLLVGLIRTAMKYAAKHGLDFEAALETARDGAESEE